MKQFSNINASEMASLKASGITEQHFKNALPFISKETLESPAGKLNVMFYIDRFGDFTSGKTKTAQIINALYKSLDKKDQVACMTYLMDSES